MVKKRVVVVVPVYNEEDKIKDTIDGLKKIDLIDEIVIINDGSKDSTGEIIKDLDVSIVAMAKNYGKGYAIKSAIKRVDYDYIAFIDGDLGYTSIEVEKLLKPVISDEVDFTIAKFPTTSKCSKIKGGFGFVKKLAKKGVYLYTKKEIDTSLSGQRVYKRKVIEDIDYMPADYGIEVAMTIQALKAGYRFKEVPVNMTHRYSNRSLQGFKHRGKQFFQIFKTLIIMFFRR